MRLRKGKADNEQSHARGVVKGLILMLIGATLMAGCVSQGAAKLRSQRSPEEAQRIERYLQTAGHLTPDEQRAIRKGRPFVGMTLVEAELAMRRKFPTGPLSQLPQELVYRGRSGTTYYLYFSVGTLQVTFWSTYSQKEAERIRPYDPSRLDPSRAFRF